MSVLVPDLKVYNAIYNKIDLYKYHTVCDINYCYLFSEFSEKDTMEFVLNLLWLNEVSYNQHYGENEQPYLNQFLEFKNEKPINTYQLLKYLECIKYNIEIETIKKGWVGRSEPIDIPADKMRSYEKLCKGIEELKSTIINELPEYKNANWSE